ncbi:MAG: hypothetical protein K8T25_23975 [Planctomycetia bacterium]|nr:hypothetical protein [Planctomycetia bacterium]
MSHLQLVVACFGALSVSAAIAPTEAYDQTGTRQHRGTVVAAVDNMLFMKESRGGEQFHPIGPAVSVVINGTRARFDDLRRGDSITVFIDDEDHVQAIICQRQSRTGVALTNEHLVQSGQSLPSSYESESLTHKHEPLLHG